MRLTPHRHPRASRSGVEAKRRTETDNRNTTKFVIYNSENDIKTRKLLVNTFIRDIIWYGDHIVITYNFQEYATTDRFCRSYVEQLEKQVGDASRSASFPLCSYKFRHSAPTSKNASLRRSAGVFLMSAPCSHERGHKKKDRTAPSAQGVFASDRRGRCALRNPTGQASRFTVCTRTFG